MEIHNARDKMRAILNTWHGDSGTKTIYIRFARGV